LSRGLGRAERYVLTALELPIEQRRMKGAFAMAVLVEESAPPQLRATAQLIRQTFQGALQNKRALSLLALAEGYSTEQQRPHTRHTVESIRRAVKSLERKRLVKTFYYGRPGLRHQLYVAPTSAVVRYVGTPATFTPPHGSALILRHAKD